MADFNSTLGGASGAPDVGRAVQSPAAAPIHSGGMAASAGTRCPERLPPGAATPAPQRRWG